MANIDPINASLLARGHDEALKKLFSSKIKENFLMHMKDSVIKSMGFNEFLRLFKLGFDFTEAVVGQSESPQYEICRNIVAIHRSNCLFDTDKERRDKETSEEYRKKLTQDVIEQLKLRRFSAVYFRKFPLNSGVTDEFQFFPVPYRLFTVTTYSSSIIPMDSKYRELYVNIFNKAMAALVLFEDGLYDSCFPICRGIIELYMKLLVLKDNPNALDEHDFLVKAEIAKNNGNKTYDETFKDKWNNRKYQRETKKPDFLHFGWADLIKDYDGHYGSRPYSAYGLLEYAKSKHPEDHLDVLETLYGVCHPYTHGGIGYSMKPISYYFDISIMLYLTVAHAYKIMCDELKLSTNIDGFDIIGSLKDKVDQMVKQNYRYKRGDIPQIPL